jgi:hypothetical protein
MGSDPSVANLDSLPVRMDGQAGYTGFISCSSWTSLFNFEFNASLPNAVPRATFSPERWQIQASYTGEKQSAFYF